MSIYRSVVLCALATFSETNECIDGQIRCLDALGATGVSGLAWARQIPKVFICYYIANICKLACYLRKPFSVMGVYFQVRAVILHTHSMKMNLPPHIVGPLLTCFISV